MNTPRPDDDRAVERLLRLAGPPPDPGAESGRRVEAALRAALARERRRRRARRLFVGVAAAAAVGAVALGLWRSGIAPSGAEPEAPAPLASVAALTGELCDRLDGARLMAGSPLAAAAEPETPDGALAALRFPEERSLRLDGATHVRLVAVDRVELLAGAVYLDSPPGVRADPIRIVAAGYEIVERGTQFEVRLDEGALTVRVREGSVELRRQGGIERISAGWLVEHRPAASARSTTRPVAPDDAAWSWVWRAAPPFPVEGRTFGEFLAWYRRETGRPLRLDAEAADRLAAAKLHGSIAGLGPDDALSTLAAAVGLDARRAEGEWVLQPVEAGR